MKTALFAVFAFLSLATEADAQGIFGRWQGPVIIVVEDEAPIHSRREELKRHPRPGEWVGLHRMISDSAPKQEYRPAAAVIACPHCGHYHARRVGKDAPSIIAFRCSHCKRDSRLILDGLDLPPVGYQMSITGVGPRQNGIAWWTYHGRGEWTRTDTRKIDQDSMLPPELGLLPSASEAVWYQEYPIRQTADNSWTNKDWLDNLPFSTVTPINKTPPAPQPPSRAPSVQPQSAPSKPAPKKR